MAETEILLKGQDDWQAFVNAMKKKMDALPSGEVEYIQNFASLSNGASADGNGLYRIKYKNMTFNLFNIINLKLPKSAINNDTMVIQFPDGTFGSHIRFSVDQGTNIDINDNAGTIATSENFDQGLSGLVGEFIWFSANE